MRNTGMCKINELSVIVNRSFIYVTVVPTTCKFLLANYVTGRKLFIIRSLEWHLVDC